MDKNINNLVNMEEIADDCRAASEYAENILNYSGGVYIGDAINEIADRNTSAYNSAILNFIIANPGALADAIDEGLYDPCHNYDLYQHGQAAQYLTIERELYDNLPAVLRLYAAEYIRRMYGDEISAEQWEAVENALDGIDSGDDLNDVKTEIDKILFPETDCEAAEISAAA